MTRSQKRIKVLENDEKLVIFAQDGFPKSATALREIRDCLHLPDHEIKQVRLYLSPREGDITNAIYDIRMTVIEECLEDVKLSTHGYKSPTFKHSIDDEGTRKIQTPVYQLYSTNELCSITTTPYPSKCKILPYDNETKEIDAVWQIDRPEKIKVTLCPAPNEKRHDFAVRSQHLKMCFLEYLKELEDIQSIQFYVPERRQLLLTDEYTRVNGVLLQSTRQAKQFSPDKRIEKERQRIAQKETMAKKGIVHISSYQRKKGAAANTGYLPLSLQGNQYED